MQTWNSSATVNIDTLSDDVLEALVVSESWRGKAGSYDLAGAMGQYAEIIDGDEETVLGLCPQTFDYLRSILE